MNFKNMNNFVKGQKLFITLLDNRNIEATFNRFRNGGKALVLRNVSFVAEDKKPFEQLEFKLDEIIHISSLDLEVKAEVGDSGIKEKEQNLPKESNIHTKEQELPSNDDTPASKSGGLGQFYEELKELVKDHVFIDQIDDKFHRAVISIQKEHTVAVIGEGSAQGRFGHLVVLGIATRRCVYLFDVVNLGDRVFSESRNFLRKFLECKKVLKIVHDCQLLADCLMHKHKVLLRNVFDTQACHVLIHKHKFGEPPESGSFFHLVSEYLKLPGHIFESKGVSLDLWRRRPLAEGLAERVSWKTILLKHLMPKLQDAYYAPFDNLCDIYVNAVREMDDEFEVKSLMQQRERESITSNILNELSWLDLDENESPNQGN